MQTSKILFIFLATFQTLVANAPYFQRHIFKISCRACDVNFRSLFHQRVLSILQKDISKQLLMLDESLSRCGSKEVDIRELTIVGAQKLFRSGALNSTELTLCYLKRIQMMDLHLKSVIQVNPDAIRIAELADKDRILRKPISYNPLHGIPVLIKDNIGTKDEMETTAGALAMIGVKPKRDAEVVERLQASGAIILGKTNPSEWAYFRSDDIPSGWSGRGGQTLSPYNLTVNPSGSSTGSAVAIVVWVGSNLAMVALGTETDGSIISPSSKGSLVGLKPTIGAVPTKGVIPLSFAQDVVGPMSRTVSDAAILMEIIMNPSRRNRRLENRKYTLGVLREFWGKNDTEPIGSQLEESLVKLGESGKVRIVDNLKSTSSFLTNITIENELIVFRHEFKYSLNKYLRHDVIHLEHLQGRKISSLADIIKFNKEHPVPEGYHQSELIASEATDGLGNQTYQNALHTNRKLSRKYLNEVMDRNKLDAVASPCDTENSPSLYTIGTLAGYPSITIPVGLNESKMPFGICFLGRENSEFLLLEIGGLMESALSKTNWGGRSTPKFVV